MQSLNITGAFISRCTNVHFWKKLLETEDDDIDILEAVG